MGEIESGTCDCCKTENVALRRLYIKFPETMDKDPVIVRHCDHCLMDITVDDHGSIYIDFEHREII